MPLYPDAKKELNISQESIYTILEKFNGKKTSEVKTYKYPDIEKYGFIISGIIDGAKAYTVSL